MSKRKEIELIKAVFEDKITCQVSNSKYDKVEFELYSLLKKEDVMLSGDDLEKNHGVDILEKGKFKYNPNSSEYLNSEYSDRVILHFQKSEKKYLLSEHFSPNLGSCYELVEMEGNEKIAMSCYLLCLAWHCKKIGLEIV